MQQGRQAGRTTGRTAATYRENLDRNWLGAVAQRFVHLKAAGTAHSKTLLSPLRKHSHIATQSISSDRQACRQHYAATCLSKPSAAQLPWCAIWPLGNLDLCSRQQRAAASADGGRVRGGSCLIHLLAEMSQSNTMQAGAVAAGGVQSSKFPQKAWRPPQAKAHRWGRSASH